MMPKTIPAMAARSVNSAFTGGSVFSSHLPMRLQSGTRLGPYEISSPIGAGGMGEIYRARDARLGREVAIKVLPQELSRDAEALARFEREARAAAALSHPNVVGIHDFATDAGISYAVLELLEGETFREWFAA